MRIHLLVIALGMTLASVSSSAQAGKVGINTTTPAAMLHVMDSSVLFTAPATLPAMPGLPPVSGAGHRLQWYTDKAALRAGGVTGTQWDRDSIGLRSTAFGYNVMAKGNMSFVGGGQTNVASNFSSFVGGGSSNTASGNRAFVGGGELNDATGTYSFVGGGVDNTASGARSAALGGGGLRAPSYGEIAVGLNNTLYTPASATTFNAGDRLFVIGNGSTSAARRNAMTVLKNGWIGINTDQPTAVLHVADSSVVFVGPATLPGSPGAPPVTGAGNRMMWYADKAAVRAGSVAGTRWDRDSIGLRSAAFGNNVMAKGSSSFVGGGFLNEANGSLSFVGGGQTNAATNSGSFVGGGYFNEANGSSSFVGGGESNDATGTKSFVGGGTLNSASGEGSFVGGGVGGDAAGEYAFVGGGYLNSATGDRAFTGGGYSLFARSYCEAVLGLYSTDYMPASIFSFNSNDRLFVIGNGTNASERSNALTIMKSGRVGIDTDDPQVRLHVTGGTDANLSNTSGFAVIGPVTSTNIVFDNNEIQARNNGAASNLFLQNEGGGVGIGVSATTYTLEVDGDAAKPGGGNWTVASDARLKERVAPFTDGLDKLLQIRPVTFHYNERSGYGTEQEYVGVIAQELQAVAPYMVGTSGKVLEDGSTGYLDVDNSAMTYMLINAVKEQQAIIEQLQQALQQEKADKAQLAAEVRQLSEALADIRAMLTAGSFTTNPEKPADK